MRPPFLLSLIVTYTLCSVGIGIIGHGHRPVNLMGQLGKGGVGKQAEDQHQMDKIDRIRQEGPTQQPRNFGAQAGHSQA